MLLDGLLRIINCEKVCNKIISEKNTFSHRVFSECKMYDGSLFWVLKELILRSRLCPLDLHTSSSNESEGVKDLLLFRLMDYAQ